PLHPKIGITSLHAPPDLVHQRRHRPHPPLQLALHHRLRRQNLRSSLFDRRFHLLKQRQHRRSSLQSRRLRPPPGPAQPQLGKALRLSDILHSTEDSTAATSTAVA